MGLLLLSDFMLCLSLSLSSFADVNIRTVPSGSVSAGSDLQIILEASHTSNGFILITYGNAVTADGLWIENAQQLKLGLLQDSYFSVT